MEIRRFVVFSGGMSAGAADFINPEIREDDFIACADSGYLTCAEAGFTPHIVIGDFDSLSQEEVNGIERLGIPRVVHPAEKEETDTMLCVRYGIGLGYSRFLIAGGIGGEFGHTMANLQTLSYLTDNDCEAEIITGSERVFIVDGNTKRTISGVFGGKFSVFSYTERSLGVSIEGARYTLKDATLSHSYPLGVSNEFMNDSPVIVSARQGRLLVIVSTS